MYRTTLSIALVVSAVVAGSIFSPATSATKYAAIPVPSPDKTLFSEYRGVKIGMSVADARAKIGSSKEKTQSDSQDQYIFSDNESALLYYDATKNVNAIMITFQGDVTKAPTAKDVFGDDVAPNAEGTIFKMERYPKAGYWISYTRTRGSDAMVNIAMQKM
jgi:hypothetical protein